MIKDFNEFLDEVDNPLIKEKLMTIFQNIEKENPKLKKEIKWNQPMYIDDKTFIIAFSVAKHHLSIAVEKKTLDLFKEDIKKAQYEMTKELFKIKEDQSVNFDLIDKLVKYNIEDKKGYEFFWRKPDFIGKL